MSDIVERLRDQHLHHCFQVDREAADEIEAYREQYAAVTTLAENLRSDNARLRRQLATAREALRHIAHSLDDAMPYEYKEEAISMRDRAEDALAALDGEDRSGG